jgi:amidase
MSENTLEALHQQWGEEATISALQIAMAQGSLTSKKLVMMYLDRIARFDQSGVKLNSVMEVNPDALFIAEALDVERAQQGPRGPLHGIPVFIKDNIDTGDHMHTSAGSVALANHYAKEDSFVAAQLRKAGAVILGKTNLTEWANFMTEKMPNGFSSRGGQVLNPYGPGTFDVGGSSAGSGAAIAANLAVVAVGTETSGSILSPASSNSLVGIKPTVGLVSRTGIIPIAYSQDTAGPMARTVADAAALLGALTGVDERDPATQTSRGRAYSDYTPFLDADALRGARIGVVRDPFYGWLKEEELAMMEAAIAKLQSEGAVVVDGLDLPTAKEPWDYKVLLYEFKSALNAYLANCEPHVPVHSLEDVIAYNEAHADAALQHGQTILKQSQETSGKLTDAEYLQARLSDLHRTQTIGLDALMKEHQLDALLYPANYGAGMPAKAGYPSITVPGGYTSDGRPLGVTFTGLAYSESKLISLAYAYEQATLHRKAPKLG